MNGMLIHNYTIPVKGIKKKIIYHFSDIHLTEYDDLSDEAETVKAKESTASWAKGRLGFAKSNNESTAEELQLSTGEHFSNLVSLVESGDAFVMTGDICDYINDANMRKIDADLKNAKVPFLAVCGNHDKAIDIPDGHVYSALKNPVQTLDLGDMLIVGFDDSDRQMTPYQIDRLKEILSQSKPMIIAMHIPVMTEGNKEKLINCGEYFRLNHDFASAETLEFIEILKQNADKIIAVFAGHLHFANNSEIAPGLTQYVSSQGLLGNVNRYEIGE